MWSKPWKCLKCEVEKPFFCSKICFHNKADESIILEVPGSYKERKN